MFRWLDAIVIIGRDMASKLLEYPQMTADKINLIPNWATLPVRYREVDPENPYRRLCGGRFIVAMSGNAGFTHDPESVFEAARILKDNTGHQFMLSGRRRRLGQDQGDAGGLAASQRHTDRTGAGIRTGKFSFRRRHLDHSLSQEQYRRVGAEPHLQSARHRAARSSSARSRTRKRQSWYSEEEIGWVVPPESPEAIAQAISSAASSIEETQRKSHQAATIASRYTKPVALKAYRDLMNGLLQRNSAKAAEQATMDTPSRKAG